MPDVLTQHLEEQERQAVARYEGPVRRARTGLYWLSIYLVVLNLVVGLAGHDKVEALTQVLLGAVEGGGFLGLGVYSRKRPLISILLGAILLFALWLYYLLFYGFNPYSGRILTFLFLIPLLVALPAAWKLEQVITNSTARRK